MYFKFLNNCVYFICFFSLQNLELLTPVGGTNTRTDKEYQYYKFLLSPGQILEAIKNYPGLPTEVAQWATNSL